MADKITKEMIETYLDLHEKITDRFEEVLSILSKMNPERYSYTGMEYYKPDSDYFTTCEYSGDFGFESECIPTHYLYDENWLEQEKQKLKEKEEKEKREKLLMERKNNEIMEQREKKEYERLKKKFG